MANISKTGQAARTISVNGIVQRVGFRRFAESLARKCKIAGYVENCSDGTVRLFVQGEEGAIIQLVDEIRKAPLPIEIDDVITRRARPIPSLKHFKIKSGPLAEEIQEGFGAIQSEFRDYRAEFGDFAKRTDDNFGTLTQKTDENFRILDTKYGEISAKLTQILEELRTENRESIDSLNKTVAALLQAVEKIAK